MKSWKEYGGDRKKVYEHDWKLLLQHLPVKHLIKQWRTGKILQNDEQYLKNVTQALQKLGPNQIMHYGRHHASTTTNVNKAPSYLLTILWLLRYAIHNKKSFDNLKEFLKDDNFKPPPGLTECSFLRIEFFFDYILVPVTDIYIHMLEKNTDLKSTLMNHFIAKPEIHWSKLKECVPYALTSTFISIILQNGSNPDFLQKNEYTVDIKNFLNKNAKENDPKKTNLFRSTNLYELFFSSVPGIISRHIKDNWQCILKNFKPSEKQMQTKFGEKTTLRNFSFTLPFRDSEDEPFVALTLQEYFEKIRTGKVPLIELIGDQPETEDVTATLTPSKRKRNEVNYAEPASEKKARSNKNTTENKRNITMTYDDYINYKNTIKNKGRQLLGKLEKANPDYNEMCQDLTTLTTAADNLFQKLDVAYPQEDKDEQDVEELDL